MSPTPVTAMRASPADARTRLDLPAVLRAAKALHLAERTQAPVPAHRLLRGKKLGLLCDSPHDPAAQLFREAAAALGAHVADVRPSLTTASAAQEIHHTARMLGRLYDALECQGMAPALIDAVARDAGVPVFDGIACPDHPTAALAAQVDPALPPEQARRYVLQAILLQTVV